MAKRKTRKRTAKTASVANENTGSGGAGEPTPVPVVPEPQATGDMVEATVLVRMGGTGTDEDPFGPRAADLAPYTSLSWTDITNRAGDALSQMFNPRVIAIRARMTEEDAAAMALDSKLWVIRSRTRTQDGVVVSDDADDVYSASERQTRINQLGNFAGFNVDTLSDWWTEDKTRQDVARALRTYLKRNS